MLTLKKTGDSILLLSVLAPRDRSYCYWVKSKRSVNLFAIVLIGSKSNEVKPINFIKYFSIPKASKQEKVPDYIFEGAAYNYFWNYDIYLENVVLYT